MLNRCGVTLYRQRIQRALEYIAANLHRPIRLSEVAKVAAFSEHHFHRIFRAMMDETLGQFITRKRMETAAQMLAYQEDRSITDIGFACGYSSTANFSKAFAAYFGTSPSSIRAPDGPLDPRIGVLEKRYGVDFRPADLYSVPALPESEARLATLEARVRFETREGFPVVCMSGEHGYDLHAGLELWAELIRRTRQLGLCGEEVDAYGITHDDPALTAEDRIRYDACIRVGAPAKDLPAPLFGTLVPAGRYAIFTYEGQVSELGQTYRDIYSLWFPRSSLAPEALPPVEHYIHDAPSPEGRVSMEILFKVRPLRG